MPDDPLSAGVGHASRPLVVVIFTGGTIAMLPDPATGAAVPALRGAELLARLPEVSAAAELEVVDWGLVPASHLRFAQLLDIAERIREAATRPEVAGIVVVQGTDVLEETAFAWDLLHDAEAPVVVVGAMRNAGEADFDGARNLADAVRAAADPRLRGQGVLVVMDGLVLPADDATKLHSQALDAFQAPNDGPLGRIAGGRLALERRRATRRRLPTRPDRATEPITLLTAVVSMDGELLRAAVRGGTAGVVVEATGSGNTDPRPAGRGARGHGGRRPGGAGEPLRCWRRGAPLWLPRRGSLVAGRRRDAGRHAQRPEGARGARPGPGRGPGSCGPGRPAGR